MFVLGGRKDRLTEETVANWRERLDAAGGEPIRFEVEFWYRDQEARRRSAEHAFAAELRRLRGVSLDWAEISPIRYQASFGRGAGRSHPGACCTS